MPTEIHGYEAGILVKQDEAWRLCQPLHALGVDSGDVIGANFFQGGRSVLQDAFGFRLVTARRLRLPPATRAIVRIDVRFKSGDPNQSLEEEGDEYVLHLSAYSVLKKLAAPHQKADNLAQPSSLRWRARIKTGVMRSASWW